MPHHPHTHSGTREGYFHCRQPDGTACVRLFKNMRGHDNRDKRGGVHSAYPTKTDKKVYIPVDRRVRQILDKYDGKLPHVCPNEMNKLIKTIGLLLGWTHDCGFDGKRLNPKRGRRFCDMLLSHTARRSFATNAYKAGVPLSSIQAITGHSSEAQLRRYLKLDAEEKAVIALKDFEGIIEM